MATRSLPPNVTALRARPKASPPAHPCPQRRIGDRAQLELALLEDLDRSSNAALGRLTMGLSPLASAMHYFGWASRLAASPGKQLELAIRAARYGQRLVRYALECAARPDTAHCIEPLRQDKRFSHPGWRRFPANLIHQAFLLQQKWWHNATTGVRGLSKRDAEAMSFAARQWLDLASPSNNPLINPEIVEATWASGGFNFVRGLTFLIDDTRRALGGVPPAGAEQYVVGRNVAITPGKVVFRNRLIELIQYVPSTAAVRREPVLLQSAWMMKYYIMDLSPHNSLVRFLVAHGHTVFAISWRNPGPADRDLGMEDYRRLGTMAALDAVSAIVPDAPVHAVGYCLGGILLTIAAAAMARDGDRRLASVTLFTTMTDFTEVGELSVFMGPGEEAFLEDMMWQQGYLDPAQVGGGFQMLRSRDLLWSRMVREYLLGQRPALSDLMAWNADGTRMPYRQQSELMRRLYRDNELFEGRYAVDGRPVRIGDIHVPIFCVAAEGDHIAPWRSVFRLHLQSEATELTFVLTSGGHNVGIVNEPGQPQHSYQLACCERGSIGVDADTWKAITPVHEGSWWLDWQAWLDARSTGNMPPPRMGAPDEGCKVLCDAPGTYVHGR